MYAIECIFCDCESLNNYLKMDNVNMTALCVQITDQAIYLKGNRIAFPTSIDGCDFGLFSSDLFIYERLVLLLFPQGAQAVPIYTRDDFNNSSCQMVILLYDATYIEIYLKDIQTALVLCENARTSGASKVVLKEAENDMREQFYV